ncbi:ABSCISIC ACID-INSENSITIVE 5-like protein 4 [Diospyros lotus]|uniref:ABSCISIC ACID-INSENSITIVE 5-like protein 4 n=1 Tax=Diospyros lotus TaxID=55363 RepID=UPI00225B1611|nr:ABSCISIC ACID-INSENSITIVE 5-like protein 4 [Diospyros lotus]
MEGSTPRSFAHGNNKAKVSSQISLMALENHSNSLANRQNPIFTLDEFQSRSGMSFGLMNTQEPINNVWDVEANQASSNANQNDVMMIQHTVNPGDLSLEDTFLLPTLPFESTMDEVWSTIQGNRSSTNNPNFNDIIDFSQVDNTHENMSLEDFLVQKGVIQGPEAFDAQQNEVDCYLNDWENFPSDEISLDPTSIELDMMLDVEFPPPNGEINIPSNSLIECPPPNGEINVQAISPIEFPPPNSEINIPATKSPIYQAITSTGSCMEGSSNNIGSEIQSGLTSFGEPHRRATNIGVLEIAAEQRQRRMIKNREAAARFQARKQAYTMALEAQLRKLRIENLKLMRKMEEVKETIRRAEALKKRLSEKKRLASEESNVTIRRTLSSDW